jgi:hypothetical protein
MALFSKFKKAKHAAEEHKKTVAAHDAKPTVPYKHVPTHAAQDALAAAPTPPKTTLTPEELQARIAAARSRRSSSYQTPLAARRSVYYSVDASPLNSRPGSMPSSAAVSLKGKSPSSVSIDAVINNKRPHINHRHSMPVASGPSRPNELLTPLPPLPAVPVAFPAPRGQRPKPYQSSSRRSSFTKRKSPLSNVSVEEGTLSREDYIGNVLTLTETDQPVLDSSTSTCSTGSSNSDDSPRESKIPKFATTAKINTVAHHNPVIQQTPNVERPQQATTQLTRRRSRWSSMLSRRSSVIAAH